MAGVTIKSVLKLIAGNVLVFLAIVLFLNLLSGLLLISCRRVTNRL